ncbi:MAG: TolC family protein [Pseudomonadota bacterium]
MLTVSGCAGDPRTAQYLPPVNTFPGKWVQTLEPAQPIPDLWRLVDEPGVKALLRIALERSPSLAQVALRVAEADALFRGQRGSLWPTFSFRGQPSRTRANGASVDSGRLVAFSNWELDLWGRLRAGTTASAAAAQASQADLQGARNALAGRVLRTLLELAFSDAIIAVELRRIEVLTLNQSLIRERYLVGLGPLADLEAARTSLAQSEAALLDRQERFSRLLRALRVTAGDYSLSPQVPAPFPVTLPAAPLPLLVLGARPDVAAAVARAKAAGAQASAAQRALLPSLSLSFDHTRAAQTLDAALTAAGLTTVLLDATAPLFRGGTLRAERDRTGAAARREAQALRETVLIALQEVDDALVLESSLTAQREARERAQRYARSNRTLFESRYRDGVANVFDLLNAQQSAFDAEVALLNTQLRQNQNRVDLGLALGLGL